MGFYLEIAMADGKDLGVQYRNIGHAGRMCQCRVAHPDPDRAVALNDRVCTDASGFGDRAIAVWVVHAMARAVEPQPVIFALDGVADQLAEMEWSEPVRAPVADRPNHPSAVPEEQNRLFEQGSVKHATIRDFLIPCRHVPGIFQSTHRCLSVAAAFSGSFRASATQERGLRLQQAIPLPSRQPSARPIYASNIRLILPRSSTGTRLALLSITLFSIVPMRSISVRITSPGFRCLCGTMAWPTPSGVPVKMRSPGSRANAVDRYSICSQTS